MIIGRKEETAELLRRLESDEAEFLTVYGRRRIGKTYLIESFFKNQPCIFFHVTGIQKGSLQEHLKEFAKEIGRVFYRGAKIEVPKTWSQAFEALHNAIPSGKEMPDTTGEIANVPISSFSEWKEQQSLPVVLFFDEFPWMATPKSKLKNTLEYYWNRFWRNNKKIKLIICGSSASWIIKKINHDKGGLHNRITYRMSLNSFNLIETKLFLSHRGFNLSHQQIMELYFVIGGVPYYLNQLKKQMSVAENINHLCFQKEGPLFEEFDQLFSSLFKEHKAYEELIRVIAEKRHGVSGEEIEKNIKLTQKGGTLTDRLEDLRAAGFIKKFLPFKHTKRGFYYRIVDEYSLFYLQWIESEKWNIQSELSNPVFWLDLVNSPRYQAWRGYAFESVCYKHHGNIKKALNLKMSVNTGTWRYRPTVNTEQGTQIDLLFDRADDAVTLCEIKYAEAPFVIDKSYAAVLRKKLEIFKSITRSKKQLFLSLITVNGVKLNQYAKELISSTVVIDDFFRE